MSARTWPNIWCLVLRRRDKSITSLCPFAPSDKIREVTLAVWIEGLWFSSLLSKLCLSFVGSFHGLSFGQSMAFCHPPAHTLMNLFTVIVYLRDEAALFLKRFVVLTLTFQTTLTPDLASRCVWHLFQPFLNGYRVKAFSKVSRKSFNFTDIWQIKLWLRHKPFHRLWHIHQMCQSRIY